MTFGSKVNVKILKILVACLIRVKFITFYVGGLYYAH